MVGYGSRVSRQQSQLYMQELDALYETCLDWSDNFLPSARWEYEGHLSGNIEDEDIPAQRVESLAYSTTFMRILAGCYHDWMEERDDWTPLANFLKDARLETGGDRGTKIQLQNRCILAFVPTIVTIVLILENRFESVRWAKPYRFANFSLGGQAVGE